MPWVAGEVIRAFGVTPDFALSPSPASALWPSCCCPCCWRSRQRAASAWRPICCSQARAGMSSTRFCAEVNFLSERAGCTAVSLHHLQRPQHRLAPGCGVAAAWIPSEFVTSSRRHSVRAPRILNQGGQKIYVTSDFLNRHRQLPVGETGTLTSKFRSTSLCDGKSELGRRIANLKLHMASQPKESAATYPYQQNFAQSIILMPSPPEVHHPMSRLANEQCKRCVMRILHIKKALLALPSVRQRQRHSPSRLKRLRFMVPSESTLSSLLKSG